MFNEELSDINIQIFGQQELVEHIRSGGDVYSHCISITNPDCVQEDDPRCKVPPVIANAFDDILFLNFWDENNAGNLSSITNPKLIDMDDVEKVLDYINRTAPVATGYTIHCWRGISRSTSIALGILQSIMRDEVKASDKLIELRRNAMPLKRSVELFDQILGSSLADFRSTVFRARMKAMRAEMKK